MPLLDNPFWSARAAGLARRSGLHRPEAVCFFRRSLPSRSRSASDERQARLGLHPHLLKRRLACGGIGHSEFRARVHETTSEITLAPLDAVASVAESLRAATHRASPEQLRELMTTLGERIKPTGGGEYEIEPVAAVRPLLSASDSLLLAPPDGFEPPTPALGRLRSIH